MEGHGQGHLASKKPKVVEGGYSSHFHVENEKKVIMDLKEEG